MKAIQIPRNGGPEVLEYVELPAPEPGEGQVQIEVKATGVNFADIAIRRGTYPVKNELPVVPGYEAAGIVSAIGPGVDSLAVGDRVVAFVSNGGYAQYTVSSATRTAKLPDNIGFPEATALLVQGLTAYFTLTYAGRFQAGDSVLVSSAAGGVGSVAVQIAKLLGAGTVVGLASTEEKRALVRNFGADLAIDYTQSNWAETLREQNGGQGVDIFLDPSGDTESNHHTVLNLGGRWVIFGSQSGGLGGLSADIIGYLIGTNSLVAGFNLGAVSEDDIAPALGQLIEWLSSGQLKILVEHRYPLAEAAQAHSDIEGRRTSGKVILEP